MSFLSVFKTIGTDIERGLGAAKTVTTATSSLIPIISTFFPLAGPLFNLVVGVETMIPSGGGAAKKAAVTALAGTLPTKVAPAELSKVIDEIVAFLNGPVPQQLAQTLGQLEAALAKT